MSLRYRAFHVHVSTSLNPGSNKGPGWYNNGHIHTYLVLGVLNCIFADKFNLNKLQKLLRVRYAVKNLAKVGKRSVMVYASKSSESIALAGCVALSFEESRDEIGSVRDKRGGVLENGRHGEHGVLPDVGMAVLKAGAGRGQQGFDELGFSKLAEETECVSTNVLIGMLEVIADAIATQAPVLVDPMCSALDAL